MWYSLSLSPEARSDFDRSALELLQSTSRALIVATGSIYLAWHLLTTVFYTEQLGWDVAFITPVVLLTCALSLWLLRGRFLLAQAIWQLGLAAAITLAIYVFQQPAVGFFYALLPLMALVTVGWPAGLVVEVLVGGLLWCIPHMPGMPFFPTPYRLGIAAGGAFAGVLGWASARTLLTAVKWYLFSYSQAQENMEVARQHRAQLAQALKELDQAYYRLKRLNIALVAARKTAEDAERFKAEFVTNVSHELRTPLNLIVGFSEMMMTSPESYGGVHVPGPYRSDLNAIYHSAQHLLALVDDVIDLARIEVGRIPLTRDQVDLASLVDEALDIVRDYIAAKGLELRVHLAPDLPALWIDRLRVRQVLLNLLVNAARFTERGWIGVDVSRQEDEIIVRVTDTGRGIPRQNLPKIFEAFLPADQPASTWHTSTGLGLPISKKFVELHHGRMGVESTYMQGTSFWFTLPVDSRCGAGVLGPLGSPTLDRPLAVARLGASERIVVVVHDDPQVARVLQRYMDGYRVVGAPTVEEGMVLAEDVKAIALVADAASDSQDGDRNRFERPLGPSPDSVLTVRCPLPDTRRAAVTLGADDLLTKPVSRQDLLAAIDRLERPVRRVLIADDDPEVVRLFRRMLRPRIPAQDCLEAYNGQEALRLIQQEKPDLVLLDLVMPVMDGQSVLQHVAADPDLAAIPVIVVSARLQDYVGEYTGANECAGNAPSWPVGATGSILVSRPAGFRLGEVVRTLEAVFSALLPGWHRDGSTEPAPAGAPAG